MGKIEDAIGKVQRTKTARDDTDRGYASSARSSDDSSAADSSQYGLPVEITARGRRLNLNPDDLINSGLLDPDYLRKHLTLEYRQLRKTLLAGSAFEEKSTDPAQRVIAVTGAMRGDGATFISLNLAMSLATVSGYPVILVDANAQDPKLTESLAATSECGLGDIVSDPDASIADLVCPTDISNLAFLPAGTTSLQLEDDLGVGKLRTKFLKMVSENPGCVLIVDSGPLLERRNQAILPLPGGRLLLVVRAGTTPRNAVRAAINATGPDTSIGVLLNGVVD